MTCYILKLPKVAKCGACGRPYPPGYAAICQIGDTPIRVVICKRCRVFVHPKIRLHDRFECLACTHQVWPGFVVISNEVEAGSHFVVICQFCTSGLDGGVEAAAQRLLMLFPALAPPPGSPKLPPAENWVRTLLEGRPSSAEVVERWCGAQPF